MASREVLLHFTVDEIHLFLSETLDLSFETLDSFVSNGGVSLFELRDAELADRDYHTSLGDKKRFRSCSLHVLRPKTVSIIQHRHRKQLVRLCML